MEKKTKFSKLKTQTKKTVEHLSFKYDLFQLHLIVGLEMMQSVILDRLFHVLKNYLLYYRMHNIFHTIKIYASFSKNTLAAALLLTVPVLAAIVSEGLRCRQ